MKEEITTLAETKGFTSLFMTEDNWYLWMCELQQWLRISSNACIEIYTPDYKDGKWIPQLHITEKFGNLMNSDGRDTFEEALEEGLLYGLKRV